MTTRFYESHLTPRQAGCLLHQSWPGLVRPPILQSYNLTTTYLHKMHRSTCRIRKERKWISDLAQISPLHCKGASLCQCEWPKLQRHGLRYIPDVIIVLLVIVPVIIRCTDQAIGDLASVCHYVETYAPWAGVSRTLLKIPTQNCVAMHSSELHNVPIFRGGQSLHWLSQKATCYFPLPS